MKTWTFDEKRPKTSGPWDTEPDKAQWIDEATGLDCLIVRGPVGALCGYVGVAPTHPWHGKDYGQHVGDTECDNEFCYEHTPGGGVEVHGGLTFASSCQKGDEDGPGICHVPEPGRPANVWWFGFDCAHAFDLAPSMLQYGAHEGDVYRDFDYVRSECASLAKQLADVH